MAFSNAERDRLYDLLPAFIRERDRENGEALRGLLNVVDLQADIIEEDIRQLQENAFIETCEPWVVAYIGDLVGTTPLFDESRVKDDDTAVELFRDLVGAEDRRIKALHGRAERSLPGRGLRPFVALRSRADVAKTIYYRRRKGTLPMLEELARDVTGWPAHAVEYFELLGWTQWLRNHLRFHSPRTPDIRSVERMDRLNGAFDEIAHAVDVRPISQDEGWHNIRNIGFHLWRLNAYALDDTAARRLGAAGDFRYFFSPLGQSAPLFSQARREGDEAGLATELHVPQPIRPARFFAGIADFYGPVSNETSLTVFVDGAEIPAARVVCRNLSIWSQPSADRIAIDVTRGRLTLGPDLVPADRVEVTYHYGFPAEMGGGPYRRRAWLMRPNFADNVHLIRVGPGDHPTIAAALIEWTGQGRRNAIIRIGDNRTYEEAIALNFAGATGNTLAIEADDGARPHLRLTAPLQFSGDRPDYAVTLSGLLVEGRVVIDGSLHRLRLLHSTLVPGVSNAETDPLVPPPPVEPSISAVAHLATGAIANTELTVEIAFSITGPIRMPAHAEGIVALDSIIDGAGIDAVAGIAADEPGPPLRSERTTIRGRTLTRQIDLATETIFEDHVEAERTQTGCVRFSYVPPLSRAPRRYCCQPDLAERKAIEAEEARLGGPLTPAQKLMIRELVHLRVKPEYTAEAYGQPAYLQLSLRGPEEIAKGAADGSEMGAYCHLKQPQREANLRLRLKEYLPFGLEYGLIYVT
jgi:hypothetical protein